jgi:hypothetical protein
MDLFKYFYNASLLMSILVILLSVFFSLNKNVALVFINYFRNDKSTIMFSSARSFLSLTIVSIFYKSSPIIVLSLSAAFSAALAKRTKKYFIEALLFFLNLVFSGTRANILSAVMVISLIYLFYKLFYQKKINTFGILLSIISSFSLILVISLFKYKDPSMDVKNLHLESEMDLFQSNWVRTFFCGFGPGQLFYTKGWSRMTSLTELSYLELIRNYGVLFSIGILAIYLYPIIVIDKLKIYSKYYEISLCLGYILYLLISATNPFLTSSTGYLLLSMFYYTANQDVFKEI